MRYRNVKINKNINKYVYRNKRRNSKMSCQLSELCNSFYSASCDCNRSNGKTRPRVGQLRTTTCITVSALAFLNTWWLRNGKEHREDKYVCAQNQLRKNITLTNTIFGTRKKPFNCFTTLFVCTLHHSTLR